MRYLKLSLLTCCCYALSLSVVLACTCCYSFSSICGLNTNQYLIGVYESTHPVYTPGSPGPLNGILNKFQIIDPLETGITDTVFMLNTDDGFDCSGPLFAVEGDTFLIAFFPHYVETEPYEALFGSFYLGEALGCGPTSNLIKNDSVYIITENERRQIAYDEIGGVLSELSDSERTIALRGDLKNWATNDVLVNQSFDLDNFGSWSSYSDGKYDYPLAMPDSIVSISASSDPLEAVDSQDLIALRKHILNIEPFTHPGQYLAADVNGSGSVTTLDYIQLYKALNGLSDAFPIGVSWIFTQGSNYFEPGEESEWFEQVKTIKMIKGCDPWYRIDLYPVKVGDVNWSAFD